MQSLRGWGLSTRAIASATGTSDRQAAYDVAGVQEVHTPEPQPVTGLDGKRYDPPKPRTPTPTPPPQRAQPARAQEGQPSQSGKCSRSPSTVSAVIGTAMKSRPDNVPGPCPSTSGPYTSTADTISPKASWSPS